MHLNNIFRPSVGADYAVSKNKTDDEIGPSTVTLSRSEGSVSLGVEMLRCAQHDNPDLLPRLSPTESVPLALTTSGHPSHSSPHLPLHLLMGFSSVDAYWASLADALPAPALFPCTRLPLQPDL